MPWDLNWIKRNWAIEDKDNGWVSSKDRGLEDLWVCGSVGVWALEEASWKEGSSSWILKSRIRTGVVLEVVIVN